MQGAGCVVGGVDDAAPALLATYGALMLEKAHCVFQARPPRPNGPARRCGPARFDQLPIRPLDRFDRSVPRVRPPGCARAARPRADPPSGRVVRLCEEGAFKDEGGRRADARLFAPARREQSRAGWAVCGTGVRESPAPPSTRPAGETGRFARWTALTGWAGLTAEANCRAGFDQLIGSTVSDRVTDLTAWAG